MSFDPNSDSNTSSHLDYANRRASVTVQNDEKRSNEYLYQEPSLDLAAEYSKIYEKPLPKEDHSRNRITSCLDYCVLIGGIILIMLVVTCSVMLFVLVQLTKEVADLKSDHKERVTLLEKEQPELRDLMRNQNYILELKINETNLEIASVELNLSSRIKMLREDWKATDNVLKEARSQIDHLEKQDFGAQIQKEKDRVSVLSNSVDEIELSFKTEVSILHHNISKTVEYLNDLSEDLNAKSNDLRQAESQINQLKNADFGDQIEKEKERISILSNNVDKIERSLKSDISDLQFNLSDTRGDLSELSTLHTVTELRLEAAEDKVKALEDADFEGQIIIEKDRITAIDTRLDRHDSEISGVKADVVDLVSDIHGVENDLGSLRSRVATVEGKVSVLQSANYGSQISILQSTVNGLRGCCQSPVIPDSPPSPTPSPADDSVDRCGEINPYGLPYPC